MRENKLGFSEQLLHESLGPSFGSSWGPDARYLGLFTGVWAVIQRSLAVPFIQHVLSNNSMPGTVLDAGNKGRQTQVLPPWKLQSSEHVISQNLHQQRVELPLYPSYCFPPSAGLLPEPRVPSLK